MNDNFTHLDSHGNVTMVDVGAKTHSERVAIAEAVVELAPATMELLLKNALPKGDVLVLAEIAGIQGAYADVRFTVTETPPTVRIEAETRTVGPTGVEMEAIVAAQTAAATIYDMCKAVQRDIVISQVRLLHKRGGKSGEFNAQDFKA